VRECEEIQDILGKGAAGKTSFIPKAFSEKTCRSKTPAAASERGGPEKFQSDQTAAGTQAARQKNKIVFGERARLKLSSSQGGNGDRSGLV